MMTFKHTKKTLLSMALSAVVPLPASASLETIIGTNFNVTYESDDYTLFSAPIISGNVISLLPINFKAEAKAVGVRVDDEADTVNFRVIPKNGQQLSKLELFEYGDYRVREEDGNDTAGATVSGLFAATNPFIANSYTSNFLEADYDSSTVAIDATATEDNSLHSWIARAGIDQSSVNNDPRSKEANWFTGTETVITVQNKLDAYAVGNAIETAYIEKKNATVDIVVSTVPVPGAVWMMITGLGLLTARRKGLSA